MRSQEYESKTVEEAIALGLNEMNLSLEEVTVDILEEGSKGFLGFIGTRMARIRLTEKPSSGQEEFESLINSVKSPGQFSTRVSEKAAEKKPERIRDDKRNHTPNTREPVRAAPVSRESDQTRMANAPRTVTAEKTDKPFRERQRPMQGQGVDRTARPAGRQAERPFPPRGKERAIEQQSPEVPAEMGAAGEFIIETAKRMDLNIEIRATTKDKTLRLDVIGDDKGVLIGHRGETLDAMQYLASLVHNKNREPYERIQLDSQNYRRKREDTLVQLANRLADKAKRTRHKVTLEPMNPYERRILHSALQNHPYVTTHSEGEEPNRRVVILPK